MGVTADHASDLGKPAADLRHLQVANGKSGSGPRRIHLPRTPWNEGHAFCSVQDRHTANFGASRRFPYPGKAADCHGKLRTCFLPASQRLQKARGSPVDIDLCDRAARRAVRPLDTCVFRCEDRGHMAQKPRSEVSAETLKRLVDAFNSHDIDAVMDFFADDCVLEMPRGPDPWGRRLVGSDEVRQGLASRFAGIPDVHYGDDRHWVAGDRGCSEWLLTGTSTDGQTIAVRGCDLFEFSAGKIARKDSYWKIVDSPT